MLGFGRAVSAFTRRFYRTKRRRRDGFVPSEIGDVGESCGVLQRW